MVRSEIYASHFESILSYFLKACIPKIKAILHLTILIMLPCYRTKNLYLLNMNLVCLSVCLSVRVLRSHQKSKHHDILAQCVIWAWLAHDVARF